MAKGSKVYAVKKGLKTGIFFSWQECEKQVKGFKGAEFKSFSNVDNANKYLNNDTKVTKSKNSSTVEFLLSDNVLEVYVDGSYNPIKKIAGYGLVIVKNSEVYLKDFSAYPYADIIDTHNVGVELLGAKRAVELALANDYKNVIIYYDYIGIEKFATKEWKAKNPQTIQYQMFMEKYLQIINIQFKKVQAHSGNKFNEIADKLAKFSTKL